MSEVETQQAAAELVAQGRREAAAISHPLMRARHQAAWLFRLAAVDPAAAAACEAELEADPIQRAQLLLTATSDRLHRGDSELQPEFGRTVELAAELDPDTRLRILNSLSELAIELGDRDRERGIELLASLIPAIESLRAPEGEPQQHEALGSALVGEGLLVLNDPRGLELLNAAERLTQDLPGREPVAVFLASAFARRDPARSLQLVETLLDPSTRLEACLQLLPSVAEPEIRSALLEQAIPAARQVAHWRGPEALVMLGQTVAQFDLDRARALFDEALEGAEGNPPQVRALQYTGVAGALAEADREGAGALFRRAIDTVVEEEERVRRVTTLALIANEMAASFPREAADLLKEVVQEGVQLKAMWEHAHLMDVLFRPDRSPYLDLSIARPLLERMLDFISDEDPRIPGVLGIPEVARSMLEIDRERGLELFWRWYRAAENAADPDGMTQAAVAIHQADSEAGREALTRAHDLLIQRVDCPSMGEYCRRTAPYEPGLVLAMAPHIPDRRERRDALVEAAIGLYRQDPAAGLEALRAIEDPASRSSALLRIVDALLGTSDRPEPQPLLEDMP